MKQMFRKTLSLLLILGLLFSFSGCGNEDVTSVELNYGEKYDMIVDSTNKINCDYLLVYNNTSSYAELDAYIDLLEKLSVSSDSSFQLCPDSLNVSEANQKIILLGTTNYNQSKKSTHIMQNIRKNNYFDYLIRSYGNVLSINWISKFGREDAFNYLLDTILSNGLNKAFNKDYSYMYLSERSDYPIVTIDDVNIVQYTVVIPEAPSYIERNNAELLVKAIKEATGTELPLVTDNAEESTYEILIGDTNRAETYVTSFFASNRFTITQYGRKLILRGGQIESTVAAVSMFKENIENSYITAEPLHVKAGYCYTGNTEKYSVNNFNGYKLVFSDEFDSLSVSEEKWNNEDSLLVTYGAAAGHMYYMPENVHLDGNNVIFRTHLGSLGYESGRLSTSDKASFKYGYFETRARFRAFSGYWVRLLLTNYDYKPANVAHIDVFNSAASVDTIFATAGTLDYLTYYENYLGFFDSSYEAYRSVGLGEHEILRDDRYHTYGVEWTETYIKFFIDGVHYGTLETTSEKYKELNTEMYLDFIVGVELNEQRVNDEVAQWPADVDVDWIRVYQKDSGTVKYGEFKTEENPPVQ